MRVRRTTRKQNLMGSRNWQNSVISGQRRVRFQDGIYRTLAFLIDLNTTFCTGEPKLPTIHCVHTLHGI
ncbi:unnamed protein product [Gadus morhua 'NCC']